MINLSTHTTGKNVLRMLILALVIFLPLIGFYLGIRYVSFSKSLNTDQGNLTDKEFTVNKTLVDAKDPNTFKYELLRTNVSGETKVIYSVVNGFGFSYEVSDNKQFIAIINYSEASGGETLTIIKNDGQLVKDFGRVHTSQILVPLRWTDNYYWLSQGAPIGNPAGVIRVDVDTLEIDYYDHSLVAVPNK